MERLKSPLRKIYSRYGNVIKATWNSPFTNIKWHSFADFRVNEIVRKVLVKRGDRYLFSKIWHLSNAVWWKWKSQTVVERGECRPFKSAIIIEENLSSVREPRYTILSLAIYSNTSHRSSITQTGDPASSLANNKTIHLKSNISHPLATENKAGHCLKWGVQNQWDLI